MSDGGCRETAAPWGRRNPAPIRRCMAFRAGGAPSRRRRRLSHRFLSPPSRAPSNAVLTLLLGLLQRAQPPVRLGGPRYSGSCPRFPLRITSDGRGSGHGTSPVRNRKFVSDFPHGKEKAAFRCARARLGTFDVSVERRAEQSSRRTFIVVTIDVQRLHKFRPELLLPVMIWLEFGALNFFPRPGSGWHLRPHSWSGAVAVFRCSPPPWCRRLPNFTFNLQAEHALDGIRKLGRNFGPELRCLPRQSPGSCIRRMRQKATDVCWLLPPRRCRRRLHARTASRRAYSSRQRPTRGSVGCQACKPRTAH